jgi:hypothetical protein
MLAAYGAWGEKSMYGRTFQGILRTTVLIGADGRVARIWRNVRVDGHADQVLEAAGALSGCHSRKINHVALKSLPQFWPYGAWIRPARECRCRILLVNIPTINSTIPTTTGVPLIAERPPHQARRRARSQGTP